MFADLPPFFFYFPHTQLKITNLPTDASSYWQWLSEQHSIAPMQGGGCIWTLQTYLQLHSQGFPCQLVSEIPDEGVIVAHRDYLPDSWQPNSTTLLVCLRADVDRHPYAQLHVVQNPYQARAKQPIELWESHFIPHWPQPAIIPRNLERGEQFENVTFLGNEINLVPEFRHQSWYDQLENLGLKFQKKLTHGEWHDYSNIDVVLAVRSMGSESKWYGKPASKLYNAWHSGVPAILGYESAFRAERKNELDYLEATSLAEVIQALSLLKKDQQLRYQMVENGWLRAKETKTEVMLTNWNNFLVNHAAPAYKDWRSMTNIQRQLFLKVRKSFISLRPMYYQMKERIKS
jgi:hypothetical protein